MKPRQIVIAVLIPGFTVALVAALLAVKGPNLNAVPSLQQVSDRTISPYCAPLTLSECPSSKAADLRREIGEKLRAGWTNRRVDSWLVANYGAAVVGNSGDTVAELFPAMATLAGTVVVAAFLRRRGGTSEEVMSAEPPDANELEQIQSELAEFRLASE